MANALIYAQSADLEVRVVKCDVEGNLMIASGNGGSLATNATIEAVQAVMGTKTFVDTDTRGNMISAVRSDNLSSKVAVDGTFAPLQVNSQGALYVDNTGEDIVERKTDDDYFTGNLTANTTLGVIDLDTGKNRLTTIQFGGETTSPLFSFYIEYSNDQTNWATDSYEPELTLIGGVYKFNITRTDVCMRYVRLICAVDGNAVFIQYSATKI